MIGNRAIQASTLPESDPPEQDPLKVPALMLQISQLPWRGSRTVATAPVSFSCSDVNGRLRTRRKAEKT